MVHFSSQAQKIKKNPPTKNSLHFRKWSFLALILKKFSQFLKRNLFLYFLKWNPELFSPNLKKKKKKRKKITPRKLLSSNVNRFLIFSQKKAFHIFRETETPKKFIIFQETELSYIPGNSFPSLKKKEEPTLKKFLIFRGRKLSTPGLKKA